MRYVALLLAGALASAPVVAVDISFTEDEETVCESEGGCMVVTRLILKKTYEAGKAAGKSECKSPI